MNALKGLFTVLITPFDTQGYLDTQGLRKLIQLQVEAGVDGIVALGTTGETPTLNQGEQEKVIAICAEEIQGKIPLVVGTGTNSTATTIEETQRARKLGADMAMVVVPYYNKPTQEGMYRHFEAVAEAVDIPLIIYNIQGRTGVNMQTETLARLAEIPSFIGVKEASGNIVQMMDVINIVSKMRPSFSVMSGDDALTLPLISIGGHGILSVVSNYIPHEVKALVDAAVAGDFTTARALHYELLPLFHGAFIETNPIPIKTLLNIAGLPAGPCRLPLCDPRPATYEKLLALSQQFSKIPVA